MTTADILLAYFGLPALAFWVGFVFGVLAVHRMKVHTVQSVAVEILQGLQDGSIVIPPPHSPEARRP